MPYMISSLFLSCSSWSTVDRLMNPYRSRVAGADTVPVRGSLIPADFCAFWLRFLNYNLSFADMVTCDPM